MIDVHDLLNTARDAGREAGEAVLAGRMTAEKAGDEWLDWAEQASAAGVAFRAGYDATGAER